MNKKKRGPVKLLWKLTPLVIKAAPGAFLLTTVMAVFHGVSWGAVTAGQQIFFDGVTEFATGKASLKRVLAAFFLLGIAYVLCHIFNGAGNYLNEMMEKKAEGRLSFFIHEKMAAMKPIYFEEPDKLDIFNKAEEGKNNAVELVSALQGVFTFYLPYFLFMAWYLFHLKPVLAVAVVLVFIPTALTQIVRTRAFGKLEEESASLRRENTYYENCMVSREYFKETRMLGAFHYFRGKYAQTKKELLSLKYKATLKSNGLELVMKLITLASYLLILVMLVKAVMRGEIPVGAFIAVFNSLNTLYDFMEELICYHVGHMAQGMGKVNNFMDFLEMESEDGTQEAQLAFHNIRLSRVSFSYPEARTEALSDISLEIKKGETLAVVGENGSGKTTLVRLLTGLYMPDKGCVEVDGQDLAKPKRRNIYEKTAVVFQKFQKYSLSLKDNIVISRSEKEPTASLLDEVCEKSSVELNAWGLKDGYETLLGKEFGGTDLSGGQWQRVAIARGYYREHELIILDEPTSAIDPYEETMMFRKFADISRGKTAVIVTHRLGSVKIADRIVVLKKGRIAEQGTFRELMDKDGEFRRMYSLQKQWYADGAESL